MPAEHAEKRGKEKEIFNNFRVFPRIQREIILKSLRH